MQSFTRKRGPVVNVTWEDKLEMYRLHREGTVLIADIAARFSIAVSTLYNYIAEVNEKGGLATTKTAPEQPTETADRVSLPQSGKTGEN